MDEEDSQGEVPGRNGARGALGGAGGHRRAALPAGQDRPPAFCGGDELRINYLQQWFCLSDPAMEEALHDTPVFREFAKIDHGVMRLADAGVLALTPDLPCTFDFRCNGRARASLVLSLRAGGTFGAPVKRVMLVGFSAGGLSSLLAADTPGVVGFVGPDPFDRTISGEAERLGLAVADRLRIEALLLRAPPSRCNAEAVAAPWGTVLPALWRDELIAGALHCDFESPTDWMCRLACGDTDPARQQRGRQGLLDAAARSLR